MKIPPSSPSPPSNLEPAPPRPNFYHNAYPCIDKDKMGEIAKNRDAAAFANIHAALADHGYRFESILFNYALTENGEPIQSDHHRIRKGDMIVTVTRPPLHDEVFCTKKYVPRSGTDGAKLAAFVAGIRASDAAPIAVIELVDRDTSAKGQDSGPVMSEDEYEDAAA